MEKGNFMKQIRNFLTGLLAAAFACVWMSGCASVHSKAKDPKVLVVTATFGFHHDCIPLSEKVLTQLSQSNGTFTIVRIVGSDPRPKDKEQEAKWEAAVKKDLAETMSAEALKKYDGVIFDNTTGDLPIPDMGAFLAWIKAGGAFIGIHAASDTFHGSPEFIAMLGGEFKVHGPQVKVECINEDPKHPATRHFGRTYVVFDEIYQFKNFHRPMVHGLLSMDKHPNDHTPGYYPVSWCKQVGKGKVFYTSLGHREDVWTSPDYQKHILGGINWALGLEPGSAVPQLWGDSPKGNTIF